MAFLDELESLGVDTREGLERVMGDESLYEMMFGIFLSTIESAPITLSEFDSGGFGRADRKSPFTQGHDGKPVDYSAVHKVHRSAQPAAREPGCRGTDGVCGYDTYTNGDH